MQSDPYSSAAVVFRKNLNYAGGLLGLVLSLCFLGSVLFSKGDSKSNVHCVKIPVTFFPFSYKPLIRAEIEHKSYTFMLDTGSSHPIDLLGRVLSQIPNKVPVSVLKYYDIQGNSYVVQGFESPPIKLHPFLTISGATVFQENIDFVKRGGRPDGYESLFRKIKTKLDLFYIDGRIGWSLFKDLICFFDFQNSSLFLAETIETLTEDIGSNWKEFIALPVELCRCGPVLCVQTEIGNKKFLLDTGASCSIYKQSAMISENFLTLSLDTGERSLGEWSFAVYPMGSELQDQFDGILGVDFFKRHRICLDLQGKKVYICPIQKYIEIKNQASMI